MTLETEQPSAHMPSGSQRELELETKLNKRTLWMALLAFIAVTELVIMIELLRQTS